MKRVLGILVIVFVLLLFGSVAGLSWLARSEQGSRWLVTTVLARLPFGAELQGVSGTLLDGLEVGRLQIRLPVANIEVQQLRLDWQPAGLLTGRVLLSAVDIAELAIDVVPSNEPPDPDRLFWLRLPVDVIIDSGRVGSLRVDDAEFSRLAVRGAIGWGRLRADYLAGEFAGIGIRLRGQLAGADPGQLDAEAQWRRSEGDVAGAGRFNGSIDELVARHVVRLPDSVALDGRIVNLFAAPEFSGFARFDNLRVPADGTLQLRAGNFRLRSDFRSVVFTGKTVLQTEALPAMPLALTAEAGFERATVYGFRTNVYGGQLTGSGAFDYRDVLTGELQVIGKQVDIAEWRADIPGRLDFAAMVRIATPTDIAIEVPTLTAKLANRTVGGNGRAQLLDGELTKLTTALTAGRSRLDADVELRPGLRGKVDVAATDLAGLYPGLRGALNARADLGGTLAQPRIRITARGNELALDELRLATLELDFTSSSKERLDGQLTISGISRAAAQLGNLDLRVNGKWRDHDVQATLAAGIADLEFTSTGSWDGSALRERFVSGSLQQSEIGRWSLMGTPMLRVTAGNASLDAHCWRRQQASICFGDSRAGANLLATSVELTRLPLTTFAPLLPAGLTVSGVADASMVVRSDAAGWTGSLRWRQQDTELSYLLDDDTVSTRLNSVTVDLTSGAEGATFVGAVRGDEGLLLDVAGQIAAPLAADSTVRSTVKGVLPDVAVLRPWLLKVVDTGDMQGVLRLDVAIDGSLGKPMFTGGAYLRDGLLQLPDAGVTLTDIELDATSAGGDALNLAGRFRSGDGVGNLGGVLGVDPAGDLRAEFTVTGKNLRTVQLPELRLDSSPDLAMRIDPEGIEMRGTVTIPKAVARIRQLPGTVAAKSQDVVVHGRAAEVTAPAAEKPVSVDVEIVLGDDVRFFGFGLESRLDGTLRLRQKPGGNLRGNGTVQVRDGYLMGYGKELRVDRGRLNFTGPLNDPGVNVQVSRNAIYEGRQYTVGLRLTGTALNVITTPFSSPAMSERDVLAFLLLDRPASTSGEDAGLSGAIATLGLGKMLPGGEDEGVVEKIGLDEISFEGAEFEQTAVVAGKRVTDDLYVRYVFGLFGEPGSFRIRYRLGRGFSVESSTGINQSIDLIYVVEK